MRKGSNPAKSNPDIEYPYYHKVIVPVYIPELKGYFIDSLIVLKVSLQSLIETIHDQVNITIVSNNCCNEVTDYLQSLYDSSKIHQLILNSENLGKVDSIIPIAKGAWENLVTIADADVLFKTGWVNSVEEAFNKNRHLGYCSPCPVPYAWSLVNNSTLLRGFIFRKIKFGEYLQKSEVLKFAKSIERPEIYSSMEILLTNQFSYQDRVPMLLGAGHFVGTFHSSVFKYCPNKPSQKKLRGNSMFKYIDLPIEKSGLNRLSTSKIYCHHIGNQLDGFIISEFNQTREKGKSINSTFTRKSDLIIFIPYKLRYFAGRLVKWILLRRLQ